MKKLLKIEGCNAKYFEGKLLEIKKTPSDNLFLRTTETVHLADPNNDNTIIRFKHTSPDMNFLVPRRRNTLTIRILNELELNKKYVFKLVPETHSKKYTVSEVFAA